MSAFTWGWIVFGIYFAVLEFAALRQSAIARRTGGVDQRGTLSEHLWWLFGINTAGRGVQRDPTIGMRVRRVALLGVLAWLVVHMLGGGGIV